MRSFLVSPSCSPEKKLAPFSAAAGRFLQFPIGDRRCNRTRASVGNAGGNARPSLTNATLAPSPLLHRRFLQHNLPFWMASLVERLLVLLIPIVAVLYPLMRFLPALYGWLMRRKIARLYGELIRGGVSEGL